MGFQARKPCAPLCVQLHQSFGTPPTLTGWDHLLARPAFHNRFWPVDKFQQHGSGCSGRKKKMESAATTGSEEVTQRSAGARQRCLRTGLRSRRVSSQSLLTGCSPETGRCLAATLCATDVGSCSSGGRGPPSASHEGTVCSIDHRQQMCPNSSIKTTVS